MARLWGAITACSRCVRWLDQCGPGECGAGDGAGFPNAGIGVPRRRNGHDQCLVRVAGRSADASYTGPDTERKENAGQARSACAGATRARENATVRAAQGAVASGIATESGQGREQRVEPTK